MPGRIEAINISRGGLPKQPTFEAVITEQGIEGDTQNDLVRHGGPNRAVLLYSLDVIRGLQAEGHSITAGSAGENLTVSGVDWAAIVPGTRLAVGETELEITRYTTPCAKLGRLFRGADFMRIAQQTNPGFSRVCAKVLKGGIVRPGDAVVVST